MSSSPSAANANSSCDAPSQSQPLPSSSRSEKYSHGSSRSQNRQDDDEGHDDDDGASVERAFSIVSFSLHRRPSVDSAFTVSTAKIGSKAASVGLANGETKKNNGSGSVRGKKADRGKVSWWTRIGSRTTKQKEEQKFDKVDEKNPRAFEADVEANLVVNEDSYPDGGLKAWMMVFGVSFLVFSLVRFLLTMFGQSMCCTFST